MRKFLLFSSLIVSFGAYSQTDSRAQVKSELVQWDAVRGEWLAESFEAMSNNQPIPDRTFPEDLTPDEMYRLVPQDRQSRIQAIVAQGSNDNPRVAAPSQNDANRRPVGTNPSTGRVPSNDRYPTYFSNPNCNLVTGRTYGDPHIRTFDGKTYSFQTVGEYVLSSSPDRSFEVQARQRPETNSVSLNTAVAMNVYGDRVGIYASDAPDPHAGTPIRVNGRSVYLNNETFYLPHGGTIENNGRDYIVTWPTGEKVQAKLATSSGMKFMNISVFVKECRGDYRGLLGNANGRSDDDFSGGNSRVNLASSTIFDPFDSRDFGRSSASMERDHLAFLAKDFGNQFLVNDQTTLFEYGFGQSSWTFYDPTFPRTHLTMSDISSADRERARRECMRQGILADDMNGCVMDFAHANIPPTPRPSVPNRVTNGRAVNPVSDRRPNVNRPDVYERVPSGGGRVPSDGGRIPTDGGRVQDGTDRDPRVPVSGDGRVVEPVGGNANGTIERAPTTPAVKRPVGETDVISRPIDNSGVAKPSSERPTTTTKPTTVRKPVPSSTTVSDRPSTTVAPERKPADNNHNNSTRPATRGDVGQPSKQPSTRDVNGNSSSPARTPASNSTIDRGNTRTSTPSSTSTPSRSTSSPARSAGSTTNSRGGR